MRSMPPHAHTFALLASFLLVACGDDGGPRPFIPRDGGGNPDSGSDSSTNPPDGGSEEFSCEIGERLWVGESATEGSSIDSPQVIARPSTGNEFVLVTAQTICPEICDGSIEEGPQHFGRRRALLYSIPGAPGAVPSEPHIVNLGLGLVGATNVNDPRLAVVADRLVVAWLDEVFIDSVNVWAQSVRLADLQAQGEMTKISAIAHDESNPSASRMARRLSLVGGASNAVALYEDYKQGHPPTKLYVASISNAGLPVSNASIGDIPDSADTHAALRLQDGGVIFGRTEPSGGTHCDYLLGPSEQEPAVVQQDPATRACGDIALADGATVYADAHGRNVLFFRALSTQGEPIGDERKIVESPVGTSVGRPAIAAFRGGYVVVYMEFGAENKLRGLLSTREGAVLESFDVVVELEDVLNLSYPSVAVSNDGSTVAITWKENQLFESDDEPPARRQTTNLVRLHCE